MLQRHEAQDGTILHIINGTDTRRVSFQEVSALIVFQTSMEAFLVRTGWSLESFAPERRQDQERRMFARGPDRRRGWTSVSTSQIDLPGPHRSSR